MVEQYLLKKRGVYYRPNSQGYTVHIRDAGLYSEKEAEEICQNCAVCPIPISTVRDHFVKEIEQLEKSKQVMIGRLADLDALKSDKQRRLKGDTDA